MNVTFRQLETFLALVRYQGVTRAAQELEMSQPGVSKTIAALEGGLGYPLFHRHGRRLILNDQGMSLVPYAEKTLDSLLQFKVRSEKQGTGLTGTLLLGCTTSIAHTVLPAVMAEFSRQNPSLSFRLFIGNYQTVIQWLKDHRVDLGLVASPCEAGGVEAETWMLDHLQFVCSRNHPLANKTVGSLADYAPWPWVVREVGSGTRKLFEEVMDQGGVKPKIQFELGSNEAVKAGVLGGLGIGCLSSQATLEEAATGSLVILPDFGKEMVRPFTLVRLSQRIYSPAVVAFRKHLLSPLSQEKIF